MACPICHTRKPRRFCPGVHADICTICCGTEREVTVDCPFDCPYLQESRKHEHPGANMPADPPNKDMVVDEEFLYEHEDVVLAATRAVVEAARATPGAVDNDVRDALESLIQTHRTLESGVYYEARSVNSLANNIARTTQGMLDEFRKMETERLGITRTKDSEVLTALVFLQRLEFDRNNGRPRGRAFLDLIRSFVTESQERSRPSQSSLIVP